MTVNKVWRPVESLNQFVSLCERGIRIKTDRYGYIPNPKKAESFMGAGIKFLVRDLIKPGLFYEAEESGLGAERGTILSRVQNALIATGLSHEQIAKRMGVSRQAVSKFLSAKNVNTETLERYIKTFNIVL